MSRPLPPSTPSSSVTLGPTGLAFGRALALCLILSALMAAQASAQTAISTDPESPAADVPFRLLVTGRTFPDLKAVDPEPEVTVEGDEITILFGGRPRGIATPAPETYAFWVDFPGGLPGHDGYGRAYTVQVDLFTIGQPEPPVRQASLPLYVRPGVEVDTPARAIQGQPATIGIEGLASCPQLGDTLVVGRDIRIDVELDCVILPPDPSHFRFEVEVESLVPGEYRVVVGTEQAPLGIGRFEVLPDPVRLQGGQFEVGVAYETADASEKASLVQAPTAESALFYFFGRDNWELMLKVLDGCDINGHYWVFGAATTDVAHDVVIEHVLTGNRWTASNPPGQLAEAITDTRAFPCGALGSASLEGGATR